MSHTPKPSTYNPKPVSQFLASLGHLDAGGCTEIRIFPKERYLPINNRREFVGKTVAGYYTDYAKAARDIAPFDGRASIYVTLNPCDKKLMRRCANRLKFNVEHTACDTDIISILWFPFDIDPVRPADTPSSDEELLAALQRRDLISDEVFAPLNIPVTAAMSGNGGHGLIRLKGYSNTDETQAEIKRLLDYLSSTYSDGQVNVDNKVGNPARIWKVYGTLACKGDNTEDAPYRRAVIQSAANGTTVDLLVETEAVIPDDFQQTDKATPSQTPAQRTKGVHTHKQTDNGEYPHLDVDAYLAHYDVSVVKKREKSGGHIWRLETCPFHPNHTNDAQVQQEANGRMGFVCPHNSCDGYNWQAFRKKIGDPKPFYLNAQPPASDKKRTATQVKPSQATQKADSPKEAKYISGERRTSYVTKIAKQQLRQGTPRSERVDALTAENQERCAPPLSDEEIEKIVASVETERFEQRLNVLKETAQRHISGGIPPKRIFLALQELRDKWGESEITDADLQQILQATAEMLLPTLLSGNALMNTQFPEPKWILPGLIAEGVTVLAGRPKMGKSFFALNVALAVAHGGSALGGIDCEQGDVLYCAGVTEGSFPEFQERLQIMMKDEPVNDHIFFMEELSRLDDSGEAQLRLWLNLHPNARLVVLDTLQSFAPKNTRRSSSEYADGYDAMAVLQRIAKDFGIAILVLTHTRKSLSGITSEWMLDEVLGSTSITGASSATLVLHRNTNGYVLSTFGRRIKNEEYAMEQDLANGMWYLLGDAERYNISDERQEILALLSEADGEPLSPSDIAQMLGKKVGNVKFLLMKLFQANMVAKLGRGKYVLPTHQTSYTNDTSDANFTNDEQSTSHTGNSGVAVSDDSQTAHVNLSSNGKGLEDKVSEVSAVSTTSDDNAKGSGVSAVNDEDPVADSRSSAFVKEWYAQHQNEMVYADKHLIRLAQAAGFDLTAENASPQANVDSILYDLVGQTIEGLMISPLGGEAYRLQGSPSSNGHSRHGL